MKQITTTPLSRPVVPEWMLDPPGTVVISVTITGCGDCPFRHHVPDSDGGGYVCQHPDNSGIRLLDSPDGSGMVPDWCEVAASQARRYRKLEESHLKAEDIARKHGAALR